MRHWIILLMLLGGTAAIAAKRAPVKRTPTYWYQVVARYEDQSDQEWVFLAQPTKGKLQGAFVWPKKDGARPYISFLSLSGTTDKGKVWLSAPNEMRWTGDFFPSRFASGRLALVDGKSGTRYDFRRAVPPPWKGREWVNILD